MGLSGLSGLSGIPAIHYGGSSVTTPPPPSATVGKADFSKKQNSGYAVLFGWYLTQQ